MSLTASADSSGPGAPYQALMEEGRRLFSQGHYVQAQDRYEAARRLSIGNGDAKPVLRALNNIGSCQYSLHQYRPALESFLEARRVAEKIGDANGVAVLDANIGSLYGQMGEIDAAAEWLSRSIARMKGPHANEFLPRFQVELASLRARQERMEEAIPLFRKAIEGAEHIRDKALYASAWTRLGEELLRRHDTAGAEDALLEGYRVRRLNGLVRLEVSYWNLGKLRLEQGDLEAAGALLDRAVEITRGPRGPLPEWQLYSVRGQVRLRQGRLRDAVADLRVALRLARAWRWSGPSDDSVHMSSESRVLRELYSAFIEAGNELYQQTHEQELIRETFEAVEENRAASLRWVASAGSGRPRAFPPEYWEAMARLQRAEAEALRANSPAAAEAVSAARAEVVRIEASLSPVLAAETPGAALLERTTAALGPDAALFSIQSGESASWLWAVDRDGLAVYQLPPRRELQAQAATVSGLIRDDSPGADAAGAGLYASLFGILPRRFQDKPRWLLALDDALLNVPVAALVERQGARPVYVAQRHTTEVIPGAGYWLEAAARSPETPAARLFVGVGDPIYNTADDRHLGKAAHSGLFTWPFLSAAAPDSSLLLPRLVASGAEVEACAAAWKGRRILLEGKDASTARLREELRQSPAVVHFATHVVASSDRTGYGMIALSLNDRNAAELLAPMEIAGWKAHVGLVVLSGCRSAAGVWPWSGLVGLTRAWLAAGARSVVSSRWDTPDEEGALFRVFYRNLSAQERPNPVEALRAAQMEMMATGDWRSRPRYWGAYFVVGN
jgi:tetratricopeptide (TPR) repeat protein